MVTARRASTLIELLVAIAIIGALVAILLPGIQAARESARRVHCADNLRNIVLGLLSFHSVHNAFPAGGWGHQWVGVPDRGAGRGQPGGWAYCTLPFVEQRELHDLGLGASGAAAVPLYSLRLKTPLSLFVCPSRRAFAAWPIASQYAYMRNPRPYGDVEAVARGDYAINAGTSHVINLGGPADLEQGDGLVYWANAPNPVKFSGISHLRIGIGIRAIVDGTSHTYLVGEKHVSVDSYANGTSPGDNESLYSGYCTDLHRFAGVSENLKLGLLPFAEPLNDHAVAESNIPAHVRFGSAHPTGVNMSFCDGSVNFVSYGASPEVHFRAGHRGDQGSEMQLPD
jgi:prepilin-type processing-associated H-X9-DG protein